MDEMYTMSLNIHIFSVISLIVTAILMMILHKNRGAFDPLVTKIQGVMVLHIAVLAFIVLTGSVMMASQHLNFTPANLLMTVAVFIIAAIEIKRNKSLVKTVKLAQLKPEVYKKLAFKYYAIEVLLIMGVGAFAGMAAS